MRALADGDRRAFRRRREHLGLEDELHEGMPLLLHGALQVAGIHRLLDAPAGQPPAAGRRRQHRARLHVVDHIAGDRVHLVALHEAREPRDRQVPAFVGVERHDQSVPVAQQRVRQVGRHARLVERPVIAVDPQARTFRRQIAQHFVGAVGRSVVDHPDRVRADQQVMQRRQGGDIDRVADDGKGASLQRSSFTAQPSARFSMR